MKIQQSFALAVSCAFAAAFGAAPAPAQSFNIDIGPTSHGAPINAYPGAALQPGFWFTADASIAPPQNLIDLAGAPSGVTLDIGGGNGNFMSNNPATNASDERLMDDVHDVGPVGATTTYTFDGLAPGGYWVYTYAWAPDDPPNYKTKISCALSADPDQTISGVWGAFPHVYQVTFARHFVILAAGVDIVMTAETVAGFGSVNGFQLYTGPCDGDPLIYCTGKINSSGCLPTITSTAGVPEADGGGFFVISADFLLCNKAGYLFFSRVGPLANPFHGGTKCVGPHQRGAIIATGCAGGEPCGGNIDSDFNAWILGGAGGGPPFFPGDSVWAQFWTRDPLAAFTDSLTNAVTFTMCF